MQILDFLLAMLPVIWLIIALSVLKMAGHKACVSALIITCVLAAAYWKMSLKDTASAALEGMLNALWPICLVIIAALFTYNLTLKTGAMEKIKSMLAGVSSDKRVLALIIGWGFGNFMEGMAGFGTAVAIPASMLAAVGLNPISAVTGCLVVNSTPTAFGSVGVPSVTLSTVADVPILELCADISLIQVLLTFISPFLLVAICGGGIKALKGVTGLTLTASLSFIIPWFAAAHLIGAELPDIIGAIVSLLCMLSYVRIVKIRRAPEYDVITAACGNDAGDRIRENSSVTDRITAGGSIAESSTTADMTAADGSTGGSSAAADSLSSAGEIPTAGKISLAEGVRAWAPFILIFILLLFTSVLFPAIHDAIAGIKTEIAVYTGPDPNTLTFSWVNTPGVMILIAAAAGGFIQKASLKDMAEVMGETLGKYWKTVLTICSVMAVAKIMGYSGMISDIAELLVAAAGRFYPLIAPLIGVLGAFVTGSGTSTSVLFGGLQSQTAASLGLSSSWIAAANMMGAGIGKMVCPQGIAIGAGAVGMVGSESVILRRVFKYCALYTVAAGLICFIGTIV